MKFSLIIKVADGSENGLTIKHAFTCRRLETAKAFADKELAAYPVNAAYCILHARITYYRFNGKWGGKDLRPAAPRKELAEPDYSQRRSMLMAGVRSTVIDVMTGKVTAE